MIGLGLCWLEAGWLAGHADRFAWISMCIYIIEARPDISHWWHPRFWKSPRLVLLLDWFVAPQSAMLRPRTHLHMDTETYVSENIQASRRDTHLNEGSGRERSRIFFPSPPAKTNIQDLKNSSPLEILGGRSPTISITFLARFKIST